MTPTLRLTRDDALVVIAALSQLSDDGLDRAMRVDVEARALLVGSRPWQEPNEYPWSGEVPIALAYWIRPLCRGENAVTVENPTRRLNLILAALTRFTRRYESDGIRGLGSAARVLDGSEFGMTLAPPICPSRAKSLRGDLLRMLIGRAIAT